MTGYDVTNCSRDKERSEVAAWQWVWLWCNQLWKEKKIWNITDCQHSEIKINTHEKVQQNAFQLDNTRQNADSQWKSSFSSHKHYFTKTNKEMNELNCLPVSFNICFCKVTTLVAWKRGLSLKICISSCILWLKSILFNLLRVLFNCGRDERKAIQGLQVWNYYLELGWAMM